MTGPAAPSRPLAAPLRRRAHVLRGIGVCFRLALLLPGIAAAQVEAPSSEGTQDRDEAGAPVSAESTPAEPEAPAETRTVVTATRLPRPLRDVPATTVVIPRDEIERSPTLTQDALVRTLPSAATFRRTPSLVADPTAQGLNLRGLAPSGVARGLVLLDGLPVNDPYGGWVFWRALPRLGLDRIEVVPTGGSALYGSAALGGVVQLISQPIVGVIDADVSVGNQGTGFFGARIADRWKRVGISLEAEGLTSDGYRIVPADQRGSIDANTPSKHLTGQARVEVQATDDLLLTARASLFRETQNGGTRYTVASVDLAWFTGSARLRTQDTGTFELGLYGRTQHFAQNRARVSADRDYEIRSAFQDVPANDQGGSLVWTGPNLTLGGTHVLAAGVDARRAAGTAQELLFPATYTPTSIYARTTRGTQLSGGLFVQDLYTVSSALEFAGTLRWDVWRNRDGYQLESRSDGYTTATDFAPRTAGQLSPRLAARLRPLDWLTLRASVYRAFRAPTLNELYRPFQVGTVLTAANPDLDAERLWGTEAGVETLGPGGLIGRITGFWNVLDAPVTNVTLATPLPDGTTRQRQNLGQARVRGVELGTDWRPARQWTVLAAYTFVDPVVTDAPGQPDLVGRQLPQDPRHRGSLSVTFDEPSLLTATAQLRVVGPQYEDDLNARGMGGAAIVDLFVSRHLFWKVAAFAAVENLFDRSYLAGRAGVDTLAPPFQARVGLRLRDGFNERFSAAERGVPVH
ncbi:TonB-dependent receptor [Corallococcus praedator]|uniref:TonB-dependent receptor n=1 Tax=Corallococcus praedator TaxID=2316724 RepID=A0ABX9Q9X6_9BACT|nr:MULTISPECIES: TonB-dependent receptor [Corallococcus]RKH32326.1 TonB-dependent receptor [Corallococcus sp. CA031C]RKH97387.1 TonB-dependent receptor [Corallococcus praedator]